MNNDSSYNPGKAMVLPSYDVEVFWGGAVPCLGAVHMDG